MNFNESLEYLYGLGNEVLAMKLGLENIGKLLDALGDPQNNYLKVQVAGTNGKGSTCAFLEAICLNAGISVGMTASPHLISVTERVRINGKEISEEDFARHAGVIRERSEILVKKGELKTVPTYFEQVTAIALNAFAEAKIELAILETGLGGRLDAITAVNAEIVAITPVDYDHQRILGNTLAVITAEKAAIIRENTKVIIATQQNEAQKVILERCRETGVNPLFISEDIQIKRAEKSLIAINFSTENDVYHDIVLGLAGKHQIVNALVAVNLAETLREFGFEIEKENIWKGLETAKNKGRLEFYEGVLFDGAHNVSGAKALREYLDEFVNQPITLVFGSMREKNLAEIAELLFPKAATLILTKPDNPRSMETGELIKFVPKDFDKQNLVVTETVEEALKIAPQFAANGIICVTGSLYLVGEAQNVLRRAV